MQDVSAALGGVSPTGVALKVGGEKDKPTPAAAGATVAKALRTSDSLTRLRTVVLTL